MVKLTSILTDDVNRIHGKTSKLLYVVMKEDKSSCCMDPGRGQPWASPNKKLAEFHCKEIAKQTGTRPFVCTWAEAVQMVISHPKNLPPDHPRHEPS